MSSHQLVGAKSYEEALNKQLRIIKIGGKSPMKDYVVASIFLSSSTHSKAGASPAKNINIILDFDAKKIAQATNSEGASVSLKSTKKANTQNAGQTIEKETAEEIAGGIDDEIAGGIGEEIAREIVEEITEEDIKLAETKLVESMQKIAPDAKINVAIVAGFLQNKTKANVSQHIVQAGMQNGAQASAQASTQNKLSDGLKIKAVSGVKHVVMVGSGKGGVGKTSVAIGLAKGLQKLGHSVAIADADILGSSVPILFGNQMHKQKMSSDGKMLNPIICDGIQLSSVAFLIGSEAALMWRGSMVSKSVLQVVTQTKWSNVDYLILDTPPATGDTHLTLMQNVKIDGALMVSTSNKASAAGVIRLTKMTDMMKVKRIGAIENMHHNLGKNSDNVGDWSIEACFNAMDLNIIAKIPMMQDIFAHGDASQLYDCQVDEFANIAKYVVEFCKKG